MTDAAGMTDDGVTKNPAPLSPRRVWFSLVYFAPIVAL